MDGMADFDNKSVGDVEKMFGDSSLKIVTGELYMPGQWHNYMELQFASATVEDDQIIINTGSQELFNLR